MTHRSFLPALQSAVLLAAGTLYSFAAEPAPNPAPKVPLTPFQQATPAKVNQALAGAWKGTFSFSRQDGGKEDVTYLVEVAPDLSTLRVSAVPPISSSPDPLLNPITANPVPADWDGQVLKAELREVTRDGGAEIVVIKKFTLRPGSDARHAPFTYQVTVKSTTKKGAVSTNVLNGEGTLTRPHKE